MKKIFTAIAISAAMLVGANGVIAQEAKTETGEAPAAKSVSPFDQSTWFDGAGHVKPGHIEAFNPADPESWMKIVNPKTHTKMHATFTNPAGYAQFTNPQLYMSMMNPNVWMKWMNPESYKIMMSGETMAYWMQPGAYVHGMQATHMMQMADPENYSKLMDSAAKAVKSSTAQAGDFSFFDPAAWAKAFSQATNGSIAGKTEDQG